MIFLKKDLPYIVTSYLTTKDKKRTLNNNDSDDKEAIEDF